MLPLRRRATMIQKSEAKPVNLVDLDAYSQSSGTYRQKVSLESSKSYYAKDIAYIQCINKWESNIGLATINEDGLVTVLDGTVAVYLNIAQSKQPEFYAV